MPTCFAGGSLAGGESPRVRVRQSRMQEMGHLRARGRPSRHRWRFNRSLRRALFVQSRNDAREHERRAGHRARPVTPVVFESYTR